MEYTGVIWRLANFNHDPRPVIEICQQYKISRVAIKMLDDYGLYNTDGNNETRLKDFIAGIRASGIDVDGWGYHRPDQAHRQGEAVNERQQKHNLSRYLADIEIEWEQAYGMPRAAEAFFDPIKKGGFEVLMTGARFPENFPNTPWGKFDNMESCDGFCPQVYWALAHNPEQQGTECIRQYREFTQKPIHLMAPVFGESFGGKYWEPSLDELTRFRTWAENAGQSRMYLYSMDWVHLHGRYDMLQAITGVDPSTPPPPPQPGPGKIRIKGLATGLTLRIRDIPMVPPNPSTHVIGMTWNGAVWESMGVVNDINGKPWVQIGPGAWVYGAYTEAV